MSISQTLQPFQFVETSMADSLCHSGSIELKHPPFDQLHHLHQIICNGRRVYPQMNSKIEKGFFYSDNKWTCYRRNYISVQCSYTITPFIPNANLYLDKGAGKGYNQILAMGVSLSAAVDQLNGKPVELIQHTPKRDKGPQSSVQIERLPPTPPTKPDLLHFSIYHGNHNASMPCLPLQYDNDELIATGNYTTNYHKTFDRIQFKSATANNGKRRAAQQYYHIIVELWADIRQAHDPEAVWVKIAQNVSAPMVVRGRSPSHYQSDGPHGNLCSAFEQNYRSGTSDEPQRLLGTRHCRVSDEIAAMLTDGYYAAGCSNMSIMPSLKDSTFLMNGQSQNVTAASGSSESKASPAAMNTVPVIEKYQYYPNTIFSSEVGAVRVGPASYDRRIKEDTAPNLAANNTWQFEGCMQLRTTDTSRGYYPNLNSEN